LVLGTVDIATVANNTFSTADIINGGVGTDTLQIAVTDAASGAGTATLTPALITNVENIRVVNTSGDSVTINATSVSGLESAEISSAATATDFDNLSSLATVLKATANTADVDFAFKATAYAGAADAIEMHLTSNANDVTVNTDGSGIESATITATGINSGGNYIGAAADLETLTVKGTGSLVIAAADLTAVTSLDASENSGGVTYGATASNVALTGGTGNDAFTGGAGNDTIMGGAGDDALTGGAGNDHIDGGAGNDTVTLSSVTEDDTVTGGEGTDILVLGAGTTYTAEDSAGSGISGFEVIAPNSASLVQNMSGLGENSIATLAVAGGTSGTIQEGAISTVLATGSATAVLGLATDSAADSLTVSIQNATGAVAAKALSLSAQDYEALTISSTGADGNSVTLGTTEASYLATTAAEIAARTAAFAARTASDLTSITVVGNKNLTVTTSAEDTALATVNASTFTGKQLTVVASSSDAAMTVSAAGAYKADITTGDGADSVTVGDGGTALANKVTAGKGNDTVVSGIGNDTIDGGTGNNTITSGAGNDSITASTGADVIDAGAGNDEISTGAGGDSITAGAGNDTVTTTSGADTVDGGDGDDDINTGAGADSITAGAGDDTIDSGTGSDYISGGDGVDTITTGTGDDTVDGGAGNDKITVASLSNGDSIDGGAGVDTLTLTSIASTTTPKNISNVESLVVSSLGTSTSIEVDLTNVTGLAALTANSAQDGSTTLTLSNLPSTLTTINMSDSGTSDTLAASFSSGPSALAVNAYALSNAATNITSLNAPLTISGKMLTTLTGTAQAYAASNITTLGTMTTDATAITIATDSLSAGIGLATTEFTIGTITDSVLESFTVNGGAYSDLTVSSASVTTTNTEFASVDLNVGAGGSLTIGEFVANSATAVTFDVNVGAQGSLVLNSSADTSFSAADVTVIGALGDQASMTYGTNDSIIGTDIVSNTWTAGVGVGASGANVVLPDVEIATAGTGTIGATSITSGIASFVEQTIGAATAPKTIGSVALKGSGHVAVTLGATSAAASATTGAANQGNISAAAMTSPLATTTIDATKVISNISITGGAGADTIKVDAGGSITITGGSGADVISLGAVTGDGNDLSTVVYEAGDSNIVQGTGDGNDTGQDTILSFGNDGADIIVVKGVSTDTTWAHTTHVLAGNDSVGASNDGAAASFDNESVLVQFGNDSNVDDAFDIAINVYTGGNDISSPGVGIDGANDTVAGSNAAVQLVVAVELTGTAGDDTLTMGPQSDTVFGGAGVDIIDGGVGGDILDGGDGKDVYHLDALNESKAAATDQTTLAGIDVITIGTGDTIDLAGISSIDFVADANDGVIQVAVGASGSEADWNDVAVAIETAIGGGANEVSIVQVTDSSSDLSFNGDFDGFYLVINDGTAAIANTDSVVKLIGVTAATEISVTSEIVSFG
jgi:Ca2+-binding RTX toxin-like protein